MAEYLLGGSFGVSGNEMDDSAGIVGSGGYSHTVAEPGIGSEMMSPGIAPGPVQNPNPLISGIMPHQQQSSSESQVEHGGMSNYHQSGPVHSYQQNEVPHKLHHYNIYNGPGAPVGGQYMSGPRFTHISDSPHSSPGIRQQAPQPLPPSQMQMYQHQGMGGNPYVQRPQQQGAIPVQHSQNSQQYSGQYGPVPHSQYQHHQQHSMQPVNQSNEMWQNTYGQNTRLGLPQGQAYPHQQPAAAAAQNHGTNAVQHTLPLPTSRPMASTQNQFMTGSEFAMSHSPVQTSTMQRSPVYRLSSSQSNQNGPHVNQTNGPPSGGPQFPHAPLSQSDPSVSSYSQGPYAPPSSQPATRPHFSSTNAVGAVSHQTPGQMSTAAVPRPMQQMGFPCASPRMNSGQQHGGPLQPTSPAQYPMSYSPNQSFNTAQQGSHVSGTSNPSQLSYASPQHIPQAPTSPQYRGPFPPHINQSPRQPTPTPPSGSPMPPAAHTPDRIPHPPTTSTPQSQGSYPSPSTSHMSSPGQGPSPGTPSNSLQHLEQMVMPRISSGPASTSGTTPNIGSSTNSVMGQSPASSTYYTHLPQSQSHHSTIGETYSQPQSPAFSHMSPQPRTLHQYLGQPALPSEQQSPLMSHSVASGSGNVQNPQTSTGPVPRTNNNTGIDERLPPGPFNPTNVSYGAPVIQTVLGPESEIQHPHGVASPVGSHLTPLTNASHAYHANQSFASGSNFEIQQIQQELQQLYSIHQNPETQQKIQDLQERLHYLQSQNSSNTSSSLPASSVQPLSSVYSNTPYAYNSNSQVHFHQSQIPQSSQHFGQQVPQLQRSQNSVLPPPNLPPPPPPSMPPPSQQTHTGLQDLNMCPQAMPVPVGPEQEMIGIPHGQQNLPMMGPSINQTPDMVPPSQDLMEIGMCEGQDQMLMNQPLGESKKKAKAKKQTKSKGKSKSSDIQQSLPGTDSCIEGMQELDKEQEGKPVKKAKKRKAKDKEQSDAQDDKGSKPKKPKKSKTKEPKERKGKSSKENKEPSESSQTEEGDDGKDLDDSKTTKEPKLKKEGKEKKETKSKNKALQSSKENKSKSTPKKKMPKIALKFGKKKKRKRLGSSENSDMEATPPPSPADGEGGIQKRRSARNTKRKKYTDDIELHLSDDGGNDSDVERAIKQSTEGKAVQVMMDINVEDFMVVEKILSMRMRTVRKEQDLISEEEGSQLLPESVEIEEFFVKYKSLSYLHCEWKSQEELERHDRRVAQKIKRFKQKRENLRFDQFQDESVISVKKRL